MMKFIKMEDRIPLTTQTIIAKFSDGTEDEVLFIKDNEALNMFGETIDKEIVEWAIPDYIYPYY